MLRYFQLETDYLLSENFENQKCACLLMENRSSKTPLSGIYALQKVRPRIVYRLFNPQVPVIVCSKYRKAVAGMPANSCASVSDSPSMICLALKRDSRTNKILRESGKFSINWLSFEPERSRLIVLDLARPSKQRSKSFDKLKDSNIPYSTIRGIPVLDDACAFVLCAVERRIQTGDHDLFISRVISAQAIEDFAEEEYWSFRTYKPILYIGSIRPNPLITL
jgi:flavin reductase (DIM6/NTAB) family NADH-FMN oxidoreductase RutF